MQVIFLYITLFLSFKDVTLWAKPTKMPQIIKGMETTKQEIDFNYNKLPYDILSYRYSYFCGREKMEGSFSLPCTITKFMKWTYVEQEDFFNEENTY
jgi:hypothetical protein